MASALYAAAAELGAAMTDLASAAAPGFRRGRRAIGAAKPAPKRVATRRKTKGRKTRRGPVAGAAAAGAVAGRRRNAGGSNTLMAPRAVRDFAGPTSMGGAVFGNHVVSAGPDHLRCDGKALIGTVYGATDDNSVVFDAEISPTLFANSWIAKQSELWETYWFSTLMLFLVPAQTSTVNATFAGYIDTDPRDRTVSGNDSFLMSQTLLGNSRSTMFTASGGCLVLPKTDKRLLYTGTASAGSETRLNSQGRATVVQTTPTVNFVGDVAPVTTPVFNVVAFYDVTFKTQNQNVLNASGGGGGGSGGNPVDDSSVVSGTVISAGQFIAEPFQLDSPAVSVDVPAGTSLLIFARASNSRFDPASSPATPTLNTVKFIQLDSLGNQQSVLPSLGTLGMEVVDAGPGLMTNGTSYTCYVPSVPNATTIELRQTMKNDVGIISEDTISAGFSYTIVASSSVTVTEAAADGLTWQDALITANAVVPPAQPPVGRQSVPIKSITVPTKTLEPPTVTPVAPLPSQTEMESEASTSRPARTRKLGTSDDKIGDLLRLFRAAGLRTVTLHDSSDEDLSDCDCDEGH